MYWNEENRSSAYGHMCFLGLKQLVEPFYNGFRDTPSLGRLSREFSARAEGVRSEAARSATRIRAWFRLSSRASIKELPVDLALGSRWRWMC